MNRLFVILLTFIATMVARADGDYRVSLVTFYPGSDIYELEGHSALRILNPQGEDIGISYGMFDFQSPGFVYRFVKGETDYWCAEVPFQLFLDQYRRQGRRVVEQQICLDSLQTQRLLQAVATNLRPENRVYRYNYVLDNCATRPLKAIEAGVGDTLRFAGAPQFTTFRNEMRHYHLNYPWYQFGIDMVLGSDLDRPITTRETGFAPVVLEQLVANATDANGNPVVCQTNVLNQGNPDGVIEAPTPLVATPIFVFWALFVVVALISWLGYGCQRLQNWCDALLFAAIGLAGALIVFLMCISVHYAVTPNYMVLVFNPLALLVTIMTWWRSGRRALKWYYIFYLLSVVAFIICVLPLDLQSVNTAIIPIVCAACLRALINIRKS